MGLLILYSSFKSNIEVVANHMGNTFDDFGQFHPFNLSSYYHNYCLIRNYENQREVELCRIGMYDYIYHGHFNDRGREVELG